MKKNILLLFAALLPLVASAEKVEINGIWYNLVSKVKQAEVTFKGDSYDSYSGEYSGSITIPATVTHEGTSYSVTSIGEYAFYNCYRLTAITLPEGVTSIGNYAFAYCESLTSITIPESVTSIGSYAFEYCYRLTAINIPENVTSIGVSAFYECNSLTAVHISSLEAWCKILFDGDWSNPLYYAHNLYLNGELVTELAIPNSVTAIKAYAFYYSSFTSITIPEGVTSIGERAFRGCSSLTSITIPESVTRIEESAFSYCSSLTSITLPEGVTSIGGWAFRDCSSLTSITLPERVTSIGDGAFSYCSSLTAITIPEGVTSIGDYAFKGCTNLTSITIPESVTSIGYEAFYKCSSLTAITIPEGVTSIGDDAFSGCSGLMAIVLPKRVRTIGSNAFANCSELTDVYCNAKTVPSTEADAFDGSYIEYATLHVPASAINSYKSTAPWRGFGKFETTSIAVERVTLSRSSATLTEGEEMTLTATVEPDDAADTSVTWSSSTPSVATVDNTGKVTAIAPGTATITVTANDGSGVSAQCELTVNELILGKCATPTISYVDGKVVFACDTEGAIVKSSVKEDIEGNYDDMAFDLIPTYTLTAYATKKDYEDSDEVTLTLCWLPCTKEHKEDEGSNEEGEEEDNSITIPSKPVLISTQGGTITVSGLDAGTAVAAYSTAGTSLATATATDGTATLATNLEAGSIAIVKIGDYSIKVAVK